ncbi:MAG: MATE family efflux transporter [Fimbriimonadaceae bacterium]|nr:MATE family efflux transporter [Fimbriimonadaceae bacterium]
MDEPLLEQTAAEAAQHLPPPLAAPVGDDPSSLRSLLQVALPLTLATCAQTIMHFCDGLFLARSGETAIAAHGAASLLQWLLLSPLQGAVSFTATLVAQYVGAGRRERLGAAVWQGIWLGLLGGGLVTLFGWWGGGLFAAIGHAPELARQEALFLRIACLGAIPGLVGSAVSGFFSGRADTRPVMWIQLCGQTINLILAYLLIFGVAGFPALGIAGAAWATVAGSLWNGLAGLALFLRRRHRREFGTWQQRRLQPEMFGRLLRFGFPSGARFTVELLGWTCFVALIGRIGQTELAATNIVWRINSMAFFPLFGLSAAVATLVGQCQGRRRPDLSRRVAWRGLAVAQVWMLACSALFVLAPRPLLGYFLDPATTSAAHLAQIQSIGVVVLRYVALYCLLDSCNLILLAALQGAGDTRATMLLSLAGYGLFIGVLLLIDRLRLGLYAMWTACTIFVMALALLWLARFQQGGWRHLQVIEQAAAPPAQPSPSSSSASEIQGDNSSQTDAGVTRAVGPQ